MVALDSAAVDLAAFRTNRDDRADHASMGGVSDWAADPAMLDWPIMLSVAPMVSDAIERSNWRVIVADLRARFGESEGQPEYDEDGRYVGGDWYEARINHFLCKFDQILVRPGSPAAAAMAEWASRLADYPLADEDDHSALELDEANTCQRCGEVLYTANGEYDTESSHCGRCRRIERIAAASYHYSPGGRQTKIARLARDRRYIRPILNRYRGLRHMLNPQYLPTRPIYPFGA